MKKRFCSLMLAIAMVLTMIPGTFRSVSAEETTQVHAHGAAKAGSITVNGSLTETDWVLHGKLSGSEASPSGSFDALWDVENLYLGIQTADASAVTVTVNGQTLTAELTASQATFSGTLAGSQTAARGTGTLELKIPFSALGFKPLDYRQNVPFTLTLTGEAGDAVYDGNLVFLSYTRSVSNMDLSYFTTKGYVSSGNHAYEQLEGGIRLYDLYDPEGKKNNANSRIYMARTNIAIIGDDTVARWAEFDFRADKMPVVATPTPVDASWPNWGFSMWMNNTTSTGIAFGIVNTKDGLMAVAGTKSTSAFHTKLIGKELGDTFRVSIGWTPDNTMHILIDGQLLAVYEDMLIPAGSFGNKCLYFSLLRRNNIPTSSSDDYDLTLSNLAIGTGKGSSVLDALTMDTILGSNSNAAAVTADLNLPGTVSDGLLTASLNWTSSDPGVISPDGKVSRGIENKAVTLTASIPGTNLQKQFTVTVAKMTLDAQINTGSLTLDGQLTEAFWYNKQLFSSGDGSVAVLWDSNGLYFGIHHNGGPLTLDLADKRFTLDPTDNTVTGGAQGVSSGNTAEIFVPFTVLGLRPVNYNKALCPVQITLGNGDQLASDAINLVLQGQLVKNLGKADKTFTDVSTTLKDNYTKNFFLNHDEDMILTQTLTFTDLPVCDGAIVLQGGFMDRFFYFIYDNMDANGAVNASYQTLMVTIYRADEAGNLYLRFANGKKDNSAPAAIPLGRKLGDTFRLDTLWSADGSATVYVDGAAVGHADNVTYRYGFSSSTASYIDMRYQGSAADKTATYTIAKLALITNSFQDIRDEITPEAIFPGVDLRYVTEDLTLPETFVSPYLGNVPLGWEISDKTVIAPDGKVTRPAGNAGAEIELKLSAFGEALWTEKVFVAAQNQSTGATPATVTAAFTASAVNLDGSIKEEGWTMRNRIQDTAGNVIGQFGAQWQEDALFLAVDRGSAASVSLTVNNKVIAVDLNSGSVTVDGATAAGAIAAISGTVAEIQLPFSALGLTVSNYGVEIPVAITAGTGSFTGTLVLVSADWAYTHNTAHPMIATTIYAPTDNGYIGAEVTDEGYHLYDLYNFQGTNPAGKRTYAIHMNNNVRPTLYDRTATTYMEFDFRANALPVTTASAATGWDTTIPNYGFTWVMTDQYPADSSFANVVSCGIFNTAEGLMLTVAHVNGTQILPIDRQLGDVIRIGTAWYPDGSVSVYIDGVRVITVENAQRWLSSIGNGIVSFNTYRDRFNAATCRADNIDVLVSNLAIGKFYGDALSDSITFETVQGVNIDQYAVTDDLVLPTNVSNNQLTGGQQVTWASSDESIIDPSTGKVTRPAVGGKPVTLTATLADGDSVALELYVKGLVPGGEVMVTRQDLDPAVGVGIAVDEYRYTLDENNNSIIAVLPEAAPVNVIALTDGDAASRLNEDVLTLWVSSDNVTYTQIKDFKLLQKGNTWYLYDFQVNAKYVKVHCTHYDGKEADFTGILRQMIKAYYEPVFGDGGSAFPDSSTYTLVNDTTLPKRDDVYAIPLARLGISDGTGLRVLLGEQLLYHYVDGENLMVRIPEIKAGCAVKVTVLSGNPNAMDISNKEYVYEVTYGAREMMVNTGGYFIHTLDNGTMVGMCNDANGQLYRSFSYNGGRTWTEPELLEACTGWFSGHGGFIADTHTGRLMYHGHFGAYNPNDIMASSMVTRFIYSDDNGVTWHRLSEVETDANYILSYSDGVELHCYDGDGENVDFVLPLGSLYNDQGSFCTRVAYSTDAGKTWQTGPTKIIFHDEGEISGAESGVSEASILEMEDGTLVMIARCQSPDSTNFCRSYSYDHGVTWMVPAEQSGVYTVNTQPMLYRYDDSDLLVWSGNNILGGNSYHRVPLNVAVSHDGLQTFVNIQDLYVKYSTQGMTRALRYQATNPALRKSEDDTLVINWTHNDSRNIMTTRVEDFTEYFYRTKGAWDSFEHGSVKYEGWSAIIGSYSITSAQATDGNYAMVLDGSAGALRSIPYFQDGVISLNLYVPDPDAANLTLELQSTHSTEYGKGSPLGFTVEAGQLTFLGCEEASALQLQTGWNTVRFDLTLTKGTATLSLNGGDALQMPVNTGIGNYLTYVYAVNTGILPVYIDEFLAWDTVTELIPGEAPAQPLPALNGYLTLNETIDLCVLLPEGMEASEAVFEVVNAATGAPVSVTAERNAQGKWFLRCSMLSNRMHEAVTIRIYDAQGNLAAKPTTTSVAKFAEALLSSNPGDSLSAMLIRMLDYGALAQLYSNVDTDQLANSVITAAQRDFINRYTLADGEAYSPVMGSTNGVFEANLTLNKSVDMNIYTDVSNIGPNEKLVVTLDGEELSQSAYRMTVEEGKIRIRYSFHADKLNKELGLAIVDSTTGVARAQIALSIRKYAHLILNAYSTIDPTLCAMMVALLDYGALAQQYAGTATGDLANRYVTAAHRDLVTNYPWPEN